ncbi:hypothetical protein K2173_010383 [Erythroxylum novogranatense]|uniref:Disease resistance R13L4/SHOC-2-like LRR domain-containing protein n=1 Tax=Erythroxylum novogranatense TaxID=1862640 RepID=A0AAV8TFA4_9ROSI|nr:hypothetical protein K2173_010383 [Erythroxylum novogranatense]
MKSEGESSRLVSLCIEAACESRESIEKWRRQRRSLQRLPSSLADSLLRRLLHRRLLFPSLLELFKHSVEVIDLRGENKVDAEWMAYLGAFQYLRSLNLADCHRITSPALWPLTGMTSLKELDLSRCTKVNNAAIKHLISIPSLEGLHISETGVTADGIKLLPSLKNLSVLDLGGLPVSNEALSSLQVLTKLEYLDLWGSDISNKGVGCLHLFPKLSILSLAWTNVTRLPNLPNLECLNMSNCTIDSLLEGDDNKAPLAKLILSEVRFEHEPEVFSYIETSFLSFLDISNSSLHGFCFLSHMKALEYLDLRSCMIGDDSVHLLTHMATNLTELNLSKTRVTSAGLAILVGYVPKLENLILSHALVDDLAISYISLMPSLKHVDLSNTNTKGLLPRPGSESNRTASEPDMIPSLAALKSLSVLETLNLENTKVTYAALPPLPSFQKLINLYLRSASLTDDSLHLLSSLLNLKRLGICDAVLTSQGLDSFKTPATLDMLDLRGCWLLSEDDILAFCRRHPQIEIRHEHLSCSTSCQRGSNWTSTSRIYLEPSQMRRNQGKMSMSRPNSHCFIDQRFKYSRERLLALQYHSLSLTPEGSLMELKMQFD